MKDWEQKLYNAINDTCIDLGYDDQEYTDNVYDVFHEALELDENSDDYRHKIKEIRKNSILDLTIDAIGIYHDAVSLTDRVLDALDVTLK